MAMNPRLLRPLQTGFNPRRLAGLEAWYDAADQSSMTIVSGAVSEWRSKATSTRTLSQSTGGNRPTLTANYYQGRSAVSFNGSNNALFNASMSTIAVSPLTVVMAIDSEIASGTNDRGVIVLRNSAVDNSFNDNGGFNVVANSAARAAGQRAAYEAYARASSGGYDLETVERSTAQPVGKRVFSVVADGTNAVLFQNGSQVDSQSGTVSYTTNGIYFGSLVQGGASALFWLGKILEVAIYTRALSATERATMERYLGQRWGITV
jgi:hypothetical protein